MTDHDNPLISDEELIADADKVLKVVQGEGLDHVIAFRPDSQYLGQCYHLDGGDTAIGLNMVMLGTHEDEYAKEIIKTNLHELTHWALKDTDEQPNDDYQHCLNWNHVLEQEVEYVHGE